MFSEERVAQMAAFLLQKCGGRMAYLKLLKLLYLADRDAMAKWGDSISGDCFVSMPHGPVLSQTYDLIRGSSASNDQGWNYWIRGKANYEVSIAHKVVNRDDFDELSNADCAILDAVFLRFGQMDTFEIRDYTHDNCAEWEDPQGSSFPIKPEAIFHALGKNENEIKAFVLHHNVQRQLDEIRSLLK
jgi:uncharacterized phage-associated protein